MAHIAIGLGHLAREVGGDERSRGVPADLSRDVHVTCSGGDGDVVIRVRGDQFLRVRERDAHESPFLSARPRTSGVIRVSP